MKYKQNKKQTMNKLLNIIKKIVLVVLLVIFTIFVIWVTSIYIQPLGWVPLVSWIISRIVDPGHPFYYRPGAVYEYLKSSCVTAEEGCKEAIAQISYGNEAAAVFLAIGCCLGSWILFFFWLQKENKKKALE